MIQRILGVPHFRLRFHVRMRVIVCDVLLCCDSLFPMREVSTPQTGFVSLRRFWTFFFALLAFNFLLRIVYARFEFLLNPDELLWAVSAREFLAGK